ncbi:MAG TPA: SOS response-associated peptidase [Anaerolineales bacterium]|nr:SOS response-associated peptidase [Anaerolineales bacterium]
MCGRFSLAADPEDLQLAFPGFDLPERYAARYNIAPSQAVLAIAASNEKRFDFFSWGLIPSWAKDPSIGQKMINARSEGISEKPSFRGPFKYKRCLVPADGFYEWKAFPGEKRKAPYYFHALDKKPFAIAGLWDEWLGTDGSMIRSLTLITTAANDLLKQYHDRMPVILEPKNYEEWLYTDSARANNLLGLLKPLTAFPLATYRVSDLVNAPNNDLQACINPYQSALL